MKLNKRYIDAIYKRLEADILEAEAGLEIYLSNTNISAIGEHSGLIEEQLKFIDNLTSAKDKLERFKEFLKQYD